MTTKKQQAEAWAGHPTAAVSDQFLSVQGTGHLSGTVQYFIRFAGCGVKTCPIRAHCDESASLTRLTAKYLRPADLADEAREAVGRGGWVHITGGEPCDQPEALSLLAQECYRRGLRVHLQTSGTVRVPIKWDWLTVSPKLPAVQIAPDRSLLPQPFGQEMVVVFDGQEGTQLMAYYQFSRFWNYYLQPLWRDGAMLNIAGTVEMLYALNRAGQEWQLGLQTHKWVGLK